MEIVIGLIIGLLVGGSVAWIVRREASALRSNAADLRGELEEVRSTLHVVEQQRTEASARLEERSSQLQQTAAELDEERSRVSGLRDSLGEAREELQQVASDREARMEELNKKQEEIDALFKGIAADVAKASNEEFRKQASEDFKRQRELAEQELKQRVEPVGKSLDELRRQIIDLEKHREGAYEGVSELIKATQQQVGQLSSETGDLREILRSSQLRGDWGERTLENILQLAGMRPDTDYQTQVNTDQGSGRADVVVRMPGGRKIVIDSKVPFDDYRAALDARDETQQQELLKSHAANVLNTARDLARVEYAENIDQALDVVVMWIPSDSILEAATRARPDLIAEAFEKHRVLLATPVTMLALVTGVAEALRQERFHEKANEIQQHAQTIYDGVRRHAEHYARLGRAISSTAKAYDTGVGSLQGDLLVGARRMRELGGGTEGKDAPELDELAVTTRSLTHRELSDLNPADAAD
ncbi:MAG: DNA recombination protein RmuC [Chloroflexota bacterium]|nr:DNA recombination protein RmuC [Chloroflexota bacterium]